MAPLKRLFCDSQRGSTNFLIEKIARMLLTLYRLALATALFIPFVNALPLIARDEVSRPIKFFELNLTQAWAAPDGFVGSEIALT